jgi:molybdopterin-binding protein
VSLSRGATNASDSARNHLPGVVRRITRTGADARVEIDCGFPLTARVTRRSAEELAIEPGMDIVASFKATAVHVIGRG